MENITKTWLKLEAFWKTYTLSLVESNYENNWRKYFWLIDEEDGEYFSDITSNYSDIKLEDDECLLKGDFVSCFWNEWKAIMWLGKYGIAKWPIFRDWVRGFKF